MEKGTAGPESPPPHRLCRLGKYNLGTQNSGHGSFLIPELCGQLLKCRNPEPGTDLLNQYPQGLGISIFRTVAYGPALCS